MTLSQNRVKLLVSHKQRSDCPVSKTTLFDSRIRKYAYREAAQIYKDIGASPDGLSTELVDAMREKYGAKQLCGAKE